MGDVKGAVTGGCSGELFGGSRGPPVRFRTVVAVYLASPGRVGHVGPIIFVETRGPFQTALVDIQNKLFFVFVYSQSAPRDGKQLVAEAENAAITRAQRTRLS